MADEKQTKQAKAVFTTLCKALDSHGWHYEKDEEKLQIECGAQGEDLPISVNIRIDAGRSFVILLSQLPFITPEDKRHELAAAVSIANFQMVDGSFDYDVTNGNMVFRMTSCFLENLLGEEAFTYMLFCSCQTIDAYNDKFMMLAKGLITYDQFVDSVKK